MKRILLISYTDLDQDPRGSRLVRALKNDFQLTVASLKIPDIPGVKFIPIEIYLRGFYQKIVKLILWIAGAYEKIYWHRKRTHELNQLKGIQFDLVIASGIDALPLALKLAKIKKSKVYFDAAEYFPDTRQNLNLRSLYEQWENKLTCNKYLNGIDLMSVESNGARDLFQKQYGVDPFIIKNTSPYYDLHPSETSDKMKIVHHGACLPARKLELMIQLMKYLEERFTLHLYLIVNDNYRSYYNKLRSMSKGFRPRIQFHGPVPLHSIPNEIKQYDIGLFMLPPTNLNYKYALPNKLFEFIQARLAIAIGPSIEMKTIVNNYDLGFVAPDFFPASLADVLNKTSKEEIMRFKQNAHQNAKALSSEIDEQEIHQQVENLLK